MRRRKAKDDLFAAFATAAKALASGRRAEIVDVLAQGERSVDDLASEIGQTVANTSQHLQVLARAGLVAHRRAGARVFYRLASDRVVDLWLAVRDVASTHLATVEGLAEAYLGDSSTIEQIDIAELAERLADGSVVLLDVRPHIEFRAGHLPAAISVPMAELAQRIGELPPGEVVAYCRGPYCVYANDAVRLLQKHGRAARRLDAGPSEWQRHGYAVATCA